MFQRVIKITITEPKARRSFGTFWPNFALFERLFVPRLSSSYKIERFHSVWALRTETRKTQWCDQLTDSVGPTHTLGKRLCNNVGCNGRRLSTYNYAWVQPEWQLILVAQGSCALLLIFFQHFVTKLNKIRRFNDYRIYREVDKNWHVWVMKYPGIYYILTSLW